MGTYNKPPNVVSLGVEGVSASTPYVLIDLSNAAGYPHTATGQVHLKGLMLNTEKASDGVYDIWAGVVLENDATDGSVSYFDVFHIQAVGNATDSTDRMYVARDYTLGGANPQGLNLFVDDSGSTPFFLTNQGSADDTTYESDDEVTSPLDDTTVMAAGDVIVWIEEVSGTGTLDFSLLAIYDTE